MDSSLSSKPKISIVIPVYACKRSIKSLCSRIRENITPITNHFEIILVDDRSPDDVWPTILDIQVNYPEVKGVQLSRNYGQHIAITAGLQLSRGDYAIVMDCDLQDPPEKIPEMILKIQEGYDYVLARRKERSHSIFRVYAAKFYFKVLSHLNQEKIDPGYGSFSILSRKVIDSFLLFKEKERHYLFILRWMGFKRGSIDYDHQEREEGQSSYSLGALVQHAIDGIFFQTTVFLRWIVMLGLFSAFSGISLAVYFVFQYFIHGAAEGWTSIVTLLLVCTGLILSSIGIVGLYIGKIFDQSKERPLYIINNISESASKW